MARRRRHCASCAGRPASPARAASRCTTPHGDDDDARRPARRRRRDGQRAGDPGRARAGDRAARGRRREATSAETVPDVARGHRRRGGGRRDGHRLRRPRRAGDACWCAAERLLPAAEPFAGEAVAASLRRRSASTCASATRGRRARRGDDDGVRLELSAGEPVRADRGAGRDRPPSSHRRPGARDPRPRAGRGPRGRRQPAGHRRRRRLAVRDRRRHRPRGDHPPGQVRRAGRRRRHRRAVPGRRRRDRPTTASPDDARRPAPVEPAARDRRPRAPSRRSCSRGPRSRASG